MKELKASEKVTQKMTRDGAVTENLATREVTSISSREAEVDLSDNSAVSAAVDLTRRAAKKHNRHKAKKAEKADKKIIREGSAARRRPSSRLQFTDEERADPALDKYIRRSDRAADKLDTAKGAIPSKKVLKKERVFDEVSGKGKNRLRFETVEKTPNGKLRHNPLSRPIQEINTTFHREIRKVESENVGVEAGHKGEVMAERGVSYMNRSVKSAIREHRMKPWRDAVKAEQAAIKANADFLYQKALLDDPNLAASNPLSRYLHKKRIQRDYAKRVRQAEKTAKNTEAAASSAAKRVKEAVQEAAAFIKSHWKGVLIVGGIASVIVIMFGGVSSCSAMIGSGVSGVFTSSYLSDDEDMLAAEAAYCAMEAELQAKLDNYAALYPGYDEYRFDLDMIGHDPYVLISILSALHEGTFKINDVQADLAMLFDMQYILTETVETETRYRTEIQIEYYPLIDPNTGMIVIDPYTGEPVFYPVEVEVQVPYDYYIVTVTLENFDLSHIPVYIMDEETLELYTAYMATLGNREDLFPYSPYVSMYTSTPTTYTIPTSVLEDETFAALITEAEKYIGFPYVWGGSNPKTSFDCSGFVSWVLTNSGVCNTGRLGAQGLYNISTPISPVNARPGDLIFFVGTYDTEGISHVGIYVGGGKMLHCGDPIQYADINTSYWQEHFYAFARPPYNNN